MFTQLMNPGNLTFTLVFFVVQAVAAEPISTVTPTLPVKPAKVNANTNWPNYQPPTPGVGFGSDSRKWGNDLFPYFEAPKNNTQTDFMVWGNKWIENVRNESIIRRTLLHPKMPGGQSCAQFYGAFSIVPISPFEVEVTCFAGKKPRNVTHELKYRFVVKWQPQDCADESKVREFFASPNSRSIQSLDGFVSDFKSKCTPTVFPVAPSPKERNLVLKATELSGEKLKEISTKPEYKDLAAWLAGENPGEGGEEPCNPLTENCSPIKIKAKPSGKTPEALDAPSAK